jgi:hypothetical protein
MLGKGGVVIGSEDVVPADDTDITIRFDPPADGTATVQGVAINEISGASLTGVQVTLFSVNGGVYQTTTAGGGSYSFSNVPAGSWQLVGFLAGYQPEMAFLETQDGETVDYSLTLSPDGQIRPGDGVKVKGILKDSKTGQPIAGAFISCMADTGYMGIPEPALWDDVKGMPTDPGTGIGNAVGEDDVAPPSGGGSSEPGFPGGGPDTGNFAPWRYDPQYQETTTGSDGSFEFANEVVGYSLYFNYNADGYLYGSHYETLTGVTGEINVSLELEPIIPTDVSGFVHDGEGNAIEGAYVEFIFGGGFAGGGGGVPVPMPPVMDLGGWAEDGSAVRGDVGAPPPPNMPGSTGAESGGADWADYGEAPADAGNGGDSGAPSGSGLDNEWMQKFRFDQQNNRGTSDVAGFNGYYSITTGADGKFSFTDIPAGPYYVIVSAYKHIPYSAEFTATEEGSNDVDVTLDEIPVGSVEGTVTDENGTPVDDVLVNATQPFVDPFSYTDGSGHFRIDNVPTGQWIISGYKQGYLTVSKDADITDGGVAHVNLTLHTYTPPPATLIPFTGRIMDGTKFNSNGTPSSGSGIAGAEIVFTPVDNNYGSYVQHKQSDAGGNYGVNLINNLDYNLLIQAPGFQDLFTRIWVDSTWPMFDYSLWPTTGGGWNGGGVVPMPGTVDPVTTEPDKAPE